MKVTKTLRKICVLVLLATAFMLAGVRGGVSAQSWDPCGCLDEKNACYDDAVNSLDQCDQSATSQHDSCLTSAYENEGYCEQACYNDYYYNGGGGDPNDCYNQCRTQADEDASFCDEEYNAQLSSCASDEYSAERSCNDEYDYCIIHCPI